MKTRFILLIAMILASQTYLLAQVEDEPFEQDEFEVKEDPDAVREVYEVSEAAHFPGGESALDSFIRANIVFSDSAITHASGRVVIGFVVEKDGYLSDFSFYGTGRIGYGVEEAILDVFRNMPKWIPAKQRGQVVRMRYRKPIEI